MSFLLLGWYVVHCSGVLSAGTSAYIQKIITEFNRQNGQTKYLFGSCTHAFTPGYDCCDKWSSVYYVYKWSSMYYVVWIGGVVMYLLLTYLHLSV